jgi:hypothetical protein
VRATSGRFARSLIKEGDVSDALEHIAGWEIAGLIDRETADRLRTASVRTGAAPPIDHGQQAGTRSAAAAMFGPSVMIAEVFAYLGGAFLLAAWSSLMARGGDDPEVAIGILSLVAAAALVGVGMWLSGRGERQSRGAGVAFLVAAGYVAGAFLAFATAAGLDWPATGVISAGLALSAAIGLRIIHPAVLSQVAVLTWLTALAASLLALVQTTFFATGVSDITGLPGPNATDPLVLVIGSAVWWLATAVLIALIGLREARNAVRAEDPAAGRRAALSRFWAGITAVVGLANAVTLSGPSDSGYGRILEPWIGVAAMLVLSAVLVERAFRRDATSFIYAAALALVVALTDLNVSYLSESRELALLLEGLILLAVGFGADRLRRRIGRVPVEPTADSPIGPAAGPPAEPPTEPPAEPATDEPLVGAT